MSNLIQARGVSKRYGRTKVLDSLNLELEEGSVYGLIGANGTGKTTTIKILMNILQADAGNADVLGVDSRKIGPREFEKIGYVSENQKSPDWMTVSYFLNYLRPFYPSWDEARAAELVRQFNLPLDRKLRHLSRGMKMKAMLTSSLAYRPRLLVMDEPFSGLDPLVREDLIGSLIESAQETSILISSHDLGDIESFATHIGYLDEGVLKFSEEMSSLQARFREIEVTTEPAGDAARERPWPVHWLKPESTLVVTRFVETRFDSNRTNEEIRNVFERVRQVSVNPMPLKAIFIALARNSSKAA